MRYPTLLTLAIVICFCASPVDGQGSSRRSALWLSGAAELSYATIECRVCNEDAEIGPAGYVQIGGSPSRTTMIAIQFSYWRADADTTAQEYALGMAVVRYYPFSSMPLFLSAGLGVGRYAEERAASTGGAWALSAHGFAFQVGAGYDFPLSGRFNFGPAVRFVSARSHQATLNQLGELQNLNGRWLGIGAQITWR